MTSQLVAQEVKKPEDNRFTKVVLAQKLEEPMQFQVLPDGRVLFAERKGKLKVYSPSTGQVKVIADIPVSTKYVSKKGEITEGEDGLQGVILDPDYQKNHWIYLYYSEKGSVARNILVRYQWLGEGLVASSKKILMEVPVQREECCHVGGGMLFDKKGNLYLTTGDNTFSRASDGFTPLDERPGEYPRDAQKSSGNTNDLRGKILRIHPEPDGTYTIPEGNLFPKGTAKARPEIYTMGNRNPWRMTIDSKTGWLYWGEVGPDGSKDDPERGPKAYDEFNQAREAGNYGWPYFVADNKAYGDYDFATGKTGPKFDPAHPVNNSPNNTGLNELPPAKPAFIWYPYDESKEFPVLESGGRSATGGPIYRRADFNNAKRPFPEYYEGKWFVTDWVRGWLVAISIDENGNYKSMERFMPDLHLKGPIDMKFGPDGDLYVIEYGNGYFKDNPEAELIRIEYNGGNRKPVVMASAAKSAGAVPFKVNLSSNGTHDFDGDALKYQWRLTKKGSAPKVYTQPNPTLTLISPGVYRATLTVTDSKGEKNSKSVELIAGNEPPKGKIDLKQGNRSFFFPDKKIDYAVRVSDKEDGSLANKRISPSQVSVSIDYLNEGFDLAEISQSQRSVDVSTQYAAAMRLINSSDCKACHTVKTRSLGPAFMEVSKKYRSITGAQSRLAKKIITGGSGVWGDAMMPAHSALSEAQANSIVKYILSLSNPAKTVKSRPVAGSYITKVPEGEKDKGSFILRAAYTDAGSKMSPQLSGEDVLLLRNPFVPVSQVKEGNGVKLNDGKSVAIFHGAGAFVSLSDIDMSGIRGIDLLAAPLGDGTGSMIEVRSGSANGQLLGKAPVAASSGNSPVQIQLTGIKGVQNLYFVLTNDSKGDAGIRLRGIRFKG